MLMIGIAGTELEDRERDLLHADAVSGLVLFARNYRCRTQLQDLIADLRGTRTDAGFVIAVDQEGGTVQRFRGDGFTRLPPLAALGALYDRDPQRARALAEEHAWVMASELRTVDVDISFAPVLDLARGSRVIGSRALHADPGVVADLADAYVRGMHLAGMAVTLKHFPGHGSVAGDTHVETASDPRPLQSIRARDMRPFVECIGLGVEAVMMAHVIYPCVDTVPASQSPVWIGSILREELGFDGLVFSDDISMHGAGHDGHLGERVQAHLAAGCDLVLACQPEAVAPALSAVSTLGARPCPADRLITLRGTVAGTWDALVDNPQRDTFISRLGVLDSEADLS